MSQFNLVPEGIIVVAGHSAFPSSIGLMEIPSWNLSLPRDSWAPSDDEATGSYKVVMQYGHLVLAIAYWPGSDFLFGLVEGSNHLVWGLVIGGVAIQTTAPPITDAQHFLWNFGMSLSLAHQEVPIPSFATSLSGAAEEP